MTIPAIGFGTSPYRTAGVPIDVEPAVRSALAAGFRLFDVAEAYGNERAVGRALRDAVRSEIVVIGKVWPTNFRPEHLRPACEASLRRLGIDQFDFYLLHSAGALRHIAPLEDAEEIGWSEVIRRGTSAADDVPLGETWSAMEQLVADGLTKRIGVSNFKVDDAVSLAGCVANEVPCWPFDAATIDAHLSREIAVFGYSPLARRDESPRETLSWLVKQRVTPICFSTNPDHIRENLAAAEKSNSR